MMRRIVLLGIGHWILPIPRVIFERQIKQTPPRLLSDDNHRVRDFVVREIPIEGQPLTPIFISKALGFAQDKTVAILDDLEKGLTFLWRGDGENVTWAYPVAVDKTPHRYTFNTGETGHAA